MVSIGAKIKAARNKKGWTQKQLAEKALCHAPDISVWETGDTMPGIITVIKLAGALGRPIAYFYKGNKDYRNLLKKAEYYDSMIGDLDDKGKVEDQQKIIELQDEKIRALKAEIAELKKLKGGKE